jgi:hypothetical protein
VFSRIGQLLGDVVWAAIGAVWARRLVRSQGTPVPEDETAKA